MPPSPRLSARSTRIAYLSATMRTSAQSTSDTAPITATLEGPRPASAASTACFSE